MAGRWLGRRSSSSAGCIPDGGNGDARRPPIRSGRKLDMPIIDAQVHCYERDRPERKWVSVLTGPPEVTGDQMVAAMDEVGVDGALLVSPYSLYRYDASYALEVYAQPPARFALIKPVDPSDPAVAETIAEWAATPGTVGI